MPGPSSYGASFRDDRAYAAKSLRVQRFGIWIPAFAGTSGEGSRYGSRNASASSRPSALRLDPARQQTTISRLELAVSSE